MVLAKAGTHTFQSIINDSKKLKQFYEENSNDIWVGYNCKNYDQYILKGILLGFDPYEISKYIIDEDNKGYSYSSAFNQIKLNIFDVMTTFHGLKQLEGFMGNDIRESSVSFDIKAKLTQAQLKEVEKYCRHDVEQTMEVFLNRIEEFESHISLIKAFKLPLEYIGKTKPQLSAIILNAFRVHGRDDEFELDFPETIRLEKYRHVLDWYTESNNRDYKKELKTEIADVPHIFAWGGLHGAINKYFGDGIFVSCDVQSLYPALMIEYDFLSRNVAEKDRYREIRDTRLKLKSEKNPMQAPYKIVLNSTYGSMKDKYNNLYDPRQANNVCVAGQLLLLDLIEKLEPYSNLIQSNTDGLILKVNSVSEIDKIKEIAKEWEQRTRLNLEWEIFSKLYQKDVNNYIIIKDDGSYKSKGSYIKKLDVLDNDMPIVNKALTEYFINSTSIEKTIRDCTDLMQFQKIVKVSKKYLTAMYGDKILKERVLRVFASRRKGDCGVFKRKTADRIEKIANTPARCFILNDSVNGMKIPTELDIKWYIDVAKKRLNDFVGGLLC